MMILHTKITIFQQVTTSDHQHVNRTDESMDEQLVDRQFDSWLLAKTSQLTVSMN
jgi:hypothetical protein